MMINNIKPCTIYLVRHGQSQWNVENLMQGKTSGVPLTKLGIKQARAAAQSFGKIKFSAIFSSDLMRARQTAQIIAFQKKLTVSPTKALRERSFGKFEGVTLEKYSKELKEKLAEFHALTDKDKFDYKFSHSIEGIGETVNRVIKWLKEISTVYAGKKVLAVAHGGVLRLLLIYLGYGTHAQLPPFSIENTAYIILETNGEKFKIKKVKGVHKNES